MISKLLTSGVRIFLLLLLFVFLFYPERYQIAFDFPGYPQSDSWYLRLTKVAFWFLIVIEVLRIFYYSVVKSKAKGLVANLITIVTPVLIILILLEMLFMYIPQSHEGLLSKASQIWWTKYWKPVNGLGYRDKEIVAKDSSKVKILVVGDSFSAGHGLEAVGERFSDQLEEKLGRDGYVVYNLGVSGADTRDEAKRLRDFPVKPDIIVLQYFPNDIEKVGREKGLTLSGAEPYGDLKGFMVSLVRRFYLPNFVYWQLPHTGFSTFEDFVKKAYTDSTILNAHLNDLSQIISYRDSTHATMYAVMVPFLFQLDKSATYTRPVEDYLQSKGVEVLTFTKDIAAVPEKERVVGKNDGHASAEVNRVIAKRLYEKMRKQ